MDKRRLGKCYELAVKELEELTWADEDKYRDDIRLVHGKIGPNKNPHAWITWTSEEKFPGSDKIYHMKWTWEPIGETFLPWEAFEKLYQATIDREYTAQEAYVSMAAYGHYGSWEGEPV